MDFLSGDDFDAELAMALIDREMAEIEQDAAMYSALDATLKTIDAHEAKVLKLIKKGTPESLRAAQELVKDLPKLPF